MSSQPRSFSAQDFAGGRTSGGSNNAAQQYRAFRAQSNDGPSFGDVSGSGNSSRGRGGNDQLQMMFKQYHDQQAAAGASGSGNKTFDSSRGRNWSGNDSGEGVETTAFNERSADGNGGNRMRDWKRSANGNEFKPGSSRDQLNRFRNSDNNDGAMKWSGGNGVQQTDGEQLRRWFRGDSGNAGQLGDGNKSPGNGQFGNRRNGPGNGVANGPGNAPGNGPGNGGQFGKWSKRDGGNADPKTASWFGKSGFGDHRGRGDGKGDWNQGNFAGDGKWNGGNWNGGKGGNRNGGKDWDRNKWGDHVRDDWNKSWWNKHGNHDWDWYRGRGWRDVPFAYGWWGGRRNFGYCYYWNGWRSNPWYWWGGCSAPLLTTWVDFGWNYPCYWDYGPGQYVTYYNNTVYVDGQRYATELDYYAQVRNLARSVPTLTQQQLGNIEWLPLGVFAVTRPGQAQANELIQLAVSKDGILSGTLLDQQTGRARPLQGMVDQATQKAAWMFADSPTDALVLETSLYNLTEPQCTALAHLDAVNTEVWQLVRLQQPQPPAGGAAPAAPPAGQVNAPAPGAPVLPPQGPVQ